MLCRAQPTTIVLPVAPGGLVHQYALQLKDFFNSHFKNVIFDLKPGAYGSIGAAAVAENKTERVTLLMGPVQNWPTHPLLDLTPVAFMGTIPGVIFVNSKTGKSSLNELIHSSKKSSISYGYPGASNNGKLIEKIAQARGVSQNFIGVPYKSGVAVTNDVIGNHIKLGVSIPNNILQHVNSSTITPLAIFGPSRSTYMPNVPTLKEIGLDVAKEHVYYNNIFLFANKTSDPKEIERLKIAIKQYLESDESIEVRKKMDIHFGKFSILSPVDLINDIISQ